MTVSIAPSSDRPLRIAMWSGPRNISTAMMRSFSSRADTAVTDEPFYGAFLKTSDEPHPMAAEIIADMDSDWQSMTDTMRGPVPDGKAIWYQKHMPHHMVGPISILDFPDHVHAFLIRAPDQVAASYAVKNELVDSAQLGFAQLVDYHKRISDHLGIAPPVVDSNDILSDPQNSLRKLCLMIGIDWDPAMLTWPSGRHADDGIWASHWYNAVDKSTGFGPPSAPTQLSPTAQKIADACNDDYIYLNSYCL
jgi:hypothetical protein